MLDHNIQELSADTLADRAEHLSSISYTNATALVKSAVVVISAQVFLAIWSDAVSLQDAAQRTAFWILSAMLAGVTQITWIQGYLFSTSRVGVIDFFAPIWIGMFEVLLFMTCDPHLRRTQIIPIEFRTLWLLFAGAHLLCCSILVANRIYLHDVRSFSSPLRNIPIDRKQRSLSEVYKLWITEDAIGSLLTSIGFFAAFAISIFNIERRIMSGPTFCLIISAVLVLPTFLIVSLRVLQRIRLIERAIISVYP